MFLTGMGRGAYVFNRDPNLPGQLALTRPNQTLPKLLKVGAALAGYEEEEFLSAGLRGEVRVCQLLKFISGEQALCLEDRGNAVHIQLVAQHHKVVLYTLGLPATTTRHLAVFIPW